MNTDSRSEPMPQLSSTEKRILVFAPTGRDAELTCAFLGKNGIGATACRDMDELAQKMREGCAAIILAEEVLGPQSVQGLIEGLRQQPSWSEIPLCVITSGGRSSSDIILKFISSCGARKVTVLERPFRSRTLLNSIEVALGARRRQYQVRNLMEEKEEILNGLEETVRERTATLQEQALRLRQLAAELVSTEQRERKRLAALLHDDLQQLLVAASMHLNNAAARMKDEADRNAVEQAKKWIYEATGAARDLTRQLRPSALYEGGLVGALHGLASEMAERHGLKVVIEGGEVATPVGDDIKALLFESIRELLFNAAKHAGIGQAAVRVWEENGSLHVIVEDPGKGFDVEAAAAAESKGGFGLFSIRERLAALGGSVCLVSAPGQGTRIELEVSLLSPPLEEQQVQAREAAPSRVADKKHNGIDHRIRILLVDDHAMVRQGLATMLDEDERMEVVAEAPDGLAAIDAAEHHSPDVVLMDINMPGMNGIEATRRIHQRWPGMIVIGLSVQDDETTAKAIRDAGASAFFSKAGDSNRLITAVVELVETVKES